MQTPHLHRIHRRKEGGRHTKNQVKQNKECALKKTERADKAKGAIQQQVVSWPQKGVFDQSLKDTKEQATGQAGRGEALGEKQGQRAD